MDGYLHNMICQVYNRLSANLVCSIISETILFEIHIHALPCVIKIDCLVICFYVPSTARSFRDGTPNSLSLAKDVKLCIYTVPTRKQTPGGRVAVHYITAAPRQLLCD